MTETAGRQCIFCDHPANSHEHIFPNWVNTLFPPDKIGPVEAIHTQVVTKDEAANKERVFGAAKLAQLTAKIVCCCCNGGWMGDMEKRARLLLEKPIFGHDVTFDPEEQVFIAAWATKIAMLGESIMEYPDSFTKDDRWLVRKQRRPPLHAMVYPAVYGGPNVATCYFRNLADMTKDGVPFTDLYIHTIWINRLLIQIRGFPSIPLSQNSSMKQLPDERFIERPIFPPSERCDWPPKFRFDDVTLGLYTTGGKEPPVSTPGIALGLPKEPPK